MLISIATYQPINLSTNKLTFIFSPDVSQSICNFPKGATVFYGSNNGGHKIFCGAGFLFYG